MSDPAALSVLFVDDEQENLDVARFNFRKSLSLHLATSGPAALELLQTEDVAVIVSDQRMPGMDGLTFLEQARKLRPDAICLLLTAYADLPVLVQALNSGLVWRYLSKPWSSQELGLAIAQGQEKFHLVRENRRLTEQLRQAQKLDAIGHLAGGIAHDFNNMLTVVLGVADALRDEVAGGAEGQELVEELVAAGERAAGLTRQLLAFARLNPARPDVLELPQLIRDFSRFLQRLVGEQVELRLDLAPDTRPVRLDPSHLEQILLNFAVNARDAMPDGGVLTFRTRNVEEARGGGGAPCVALEAIDTGFGMDEAVRARLFEPFFTTKPAGHGTGLGLSTVYGIVRQADGRIDVDSAPGRGSTFRVLLPPVAAVPNVAAPAASTDASRGSGTILLVEDDAPVRAVTRRLLVAAGYEVLEAANGAAALAALAAGASPALLLTDVVMPGLSGPALAALVRERLPALPIVFVSGHTHSAEVLDGLGPLVRKPYAGEALVRAIAAALQP